MNRRAWNWISSACAVAIAASGSAATITWVGAAGNGLWADAGNWSGNVVPGETDWAIVNSATIDLGGSNPNTRYLQPSGTVTLMNGSLGVMFVLGAANAELNGTLQPVGNSVLLMGAGHGPMRFNGDVLGANSLSLSSVVIQQPLSHTGEAWLSSSTVALEGSIASTHLSMGGLVTLENSALARSGRLKPAAVVDSFDRLELIGNSTTAVEESLKSVTSTSSEATVSLDGRGAPLHLHVESLNLSSSTLFRFNLTQRDSARFTTDVSPQMLGGTGGMEVPILRNAYATIGPTQVAPTSTRAFLTYDTTMTPGGTGPRDVVGYRALRDDEYTWSLGSATSLANVALKDVVTVTKSQSINTLTLDSNAFVDLGNSSLTLQAGVLMRRGANNVRSSYLVSTGGGKLVSTRPLDVLALSSLSIDAPIDAPSLSLFETSVSLSGNNVLPGGVTVVDSGLRIIRPQALGAGPLTVRRGQVEFTGSQSVPNAIVLPGSASFRVDSGQVVTVTGRVTGTGGIDNSGYGLLRLVGGGEFSGSIGGSDLSRSHIELGGSWSRPLGDPSDINASGNLFGTGEAAIAFRTGVISAGSPGRVGSFVINRLGVAYSSDPITIAIDIEGADADKLITTLERAPEMNASFALSVSVRSAPTSSLYTIIQNDAAGAAINPFAGIAEGELISSGGYQFRVSYVGGDGNDVTLTVLPEPGVATVGGVLLAFRRRRAS